MTPGTFVLPTFGLASRPQRINQDTEVYINLYYASRIASLVKERLAQQNHKGPAINLVRQVAREMYDKEDVATRAAVAAEVVSQAESKAREDEALLEIQALGPTPQQYQQ